MSQKNYEVESILKSQKRKKGGVFYLVKWQGDEWKNQWIPFERMYRCAEYRATFHGYNTEAAVPQKKTLTTRKRKMKAKINRDNQQNCLKLETFLAATKWELPLELQEEILKYLIKKFEY
jgi:hypothetical protein